MDDNFNIDTLPIADEIKNNFERIIDLLGEDKDREGLETPLRAAKAMKFLTQGYKIEPKQILQNALFDEDYNEMVIVKDIELYSLCEHHMLPFLVKLILHIFLTGRLLV